MECKKQQLFPLKTLLDVTENDILGLYIYIYKCNATPCNFVLAGGPSEVGR